METLQAIHFGQKHPTFAYEAYEIMCKVRRLSKKHQRQCENACNGAGKINGQAYYLGQIDNDARLEYGYDVKSGYVGDTTVFQQEIKKIEGKIDRIISNTPFKVAYQHDPRGWTVKLFYEDDFIVW